MGAAEGPLVPVLTYTALLGVLSRHIFCSPLGRILDIQRRRSSYHKAPGPSLSESTSRTLCVQSWHKRRTSPAQTLSPRPTEATRPRLRPRLHPPSAPVPSSPAAFPPPRTSHTSHTAPMPILHHEIHCPATTSPASPLGPTSHGGPTYPSSQDYPRTAMMEKVAAEATCAHRPPTLRPVPSRGRVS